MWLAGPALAQPNKDVFSVTVPYKKIGMNDTIEVICKYIHTEQDTTNGIELTDILDYDSTRKTTRPKAIVEAPFKDFILLKSQPKTTSEIALSGGKYSYTWTSEIAYQITPKRVGTLQIPQLVMKLHGKPYRQTTAVLIVVVPGTLMPHEKNGPKRLAADSVDIIRALAKNSNTYLVSTGCLTAINSTDSEKIAVMQDMSVELLNMQTSCSDLGRYYWGGVPRRYLLVQDTAGVRSTIDPVYRTTKCGFATFITPAKVWNCKKELDALEERKEDFLHPKKDYIKTRK